MRYSQMKVLKPPKLNDGDTVGVIAPSHPVPPFQKMYDRGIANLKAFGFRVKEGKTVKLTHMGYMAGTDTQRAEDINDTFAGEEVKAIICAIGGQVAIQILEIAGDYDFPILANVDFGHYRPNFPLPLGLKASIDTEEVNLSIDECYVK